MNIHSDGQSTALPKMISKRGWWVCAFVLATLAFLYVYAALPGFKTKRYWCRSGGSLLQNSLKLTYNRPEIIQRELTNALTLRLVAKSVGLGDIELQSIRVPERGNEWFEVYGFNKDDKSFNLFCEQLQRYANERENGHTRVYLLEALTNHIALLKMSDPGLQALAAKYKLLSLSRLKVSDSGFTTNKAGVLKSGIISIKVVNGKSITNEVRNIPRTDEVCKWVTYTLVDGGIAWCYQVVFNADGTVEYIRDSRIDAKEFDARFVKTIKAVESEVEREMKRKGTYGNFGSVHEFWYLKKEKLKARGIDWKSPAELNPHVNYD